MEISNSNIWSYFLHSRQGKTLIIYTISYWFVALLVGVFDVAPPFNLSATYTIRVCVIFPLCLLIIYLKGNYFPSFSMSTLSDDILFGTYGALPIVILLWRI